MKNSSIKKAVIAVAGFGTRFLPATKAQPKEMLTLIDKPVIQYIVEEAVAAGIEMIVFVTSQNKRAIEDHFDKSFELEYLLKKKKKLDVLEQIQKIHSMAEFVYIRQKSPRGWGDAILLTEKIIGDEPFAYLSGDDVFLSKEPAIGQLMDVYERYHDGVLGVTRVSKEDTSKYGVIGGTEIGEGVYEVNEFIEKPGPKHAPSTLASVARYIFTPDIFGALKKTKLVGGELVGADAIRNLLKTKPFYAKEYEGKNYDCGNKLGFLQATVDFALQSEFKKEFLDFLKEKVR